MTNEAQNQKDHCPKIDVCPMATDHLRYNAANIYQKRYCKSDFSQCARYQIVSTLGPKHVPKTLLPNMNSEAQEIIDSVTVA